LQETKNLRNLIFAGFLFYFVGTESISARSGFVDATTTTAKGGMLVELLKIKIKG
jgi:hypothetical protein